MSRNDEKTLGVHLDLYSKYMESVKVGVLDFYVLSLSLSHVLYLIQKKRRKYIVWIFIFMAAISIEKFLYFIYLWYIPGNYFAGNVIQKDLFDGVV